MKLEHVSPDRLHPNPWNPNRQDDKTKAKERRSIEQLGFVDPITVRENDGLLQIIDGEHRWLAAKDLVLPTVPIINLGHVEDSKAKKLTVLLNELRGRVDPLRLADLVADLAVGEKVEDLALLLPMSQAEIDSLIKSRQFDWEAEVAKDKGDLYETPDDEVPFVLGNVKGDLPKWLGDELLKAWAATSAEVKSKSAENVLKVWLERVRREP